MFHVSILHRPITERDNVEDTYADPLRERDEDTEE